MFLEHMIAPMPGDADYDASYFAGGRVSAAGMEKLFTAGRFLFEVEPWTVVDDQQVLRMDIPALDVDGACLSVIGQRGAESPGVLVFPSLHGFKHFLKATSTGAIEKGSDALGSELLAVTFESAVELPPSMRHEAMEHRWPVATADAYPLVERRAPDGAASARRPGLPDRHGLRAIVRRVLRQACGDLRVDHLRRCLRVVLQRQRTGGALHRSPRWPWDFGLTESAEREPHSPGPDEKVPAEGWPEEPCTCGRGRRYKMCHLAQDEG